MPVPIESRTVSVSIFHLVVLVLETHANAGGIQSTSPSIPDA